MAGTLVVTAHGGRGLPGAGPHLVLTVDRAVTHQHAPVDDGGIDDRTRGRVHERRVERCEQEFGRVEVEDDAHLARVHVQMAAAGFGVRLVGLEGRLVPDRVAAGRLDLDHLCAETGQQLARVVERTVRQIEDAQSLTERGTKIAAWMRSSGTSRTW